MAPTEELFLYSACAHIAILRKSIRQFDHQGLGFISQPRALLRPGPVPLILQLHVEFPKDLAKDKSALSEEKPSDTPYQLATEGHTYRRHDQMIEV